MLMQDQHLYKGPAKTKLLCLWSLSVTPNETVVALLNFFNQGVKISGIVRD